MNASNRWGQPLLSTTTHTDFDNAIYTFAVFIFLNAYVCVYGNIMCQRLHICISVYVCDCICLQCILCVRVHVCLCAFLPAVLPQFSSSAPLGQSCCPLQCCGWGKHTDRFPHGNWPNGHISEPEESTYTQTHALKQGNDKVCSDIGLSFDC